MREREAVKLYDGITNVKDEFVEEAQKVRLKNRKFLKLRQGAVAAALCLAAGLGALGFPGWTDRDDGGNADGRFWGDGDHTLLEVRREEFSSELSPEEEAAFAGKPGVLKSYRTLYNEWFLAEDLTDFSQALGSEVYYIVPEFSLGFGETTEDGSYGVFTLGEDGSPRWGMGASAPANRIVPYGFCRLTREIIEEDLAGVDYEDYIIAESTRLYTVFVWARCPGGEDVFVTYCKIPEFLHLENRGKYTLEEIRQILTKDYDGS